MNEQDPWESWFSGLREDSRAAIQRRLEAPPIEEESEAYAEWLGTLGEDVQEALANCAQQVDECWRGGLPTKNGMRYGLIECLAENRPVMRIFPDPFLLVRRLVELDGQDVTVWMFYGVPLPLTKGPLRYLLLPGAEYALPVVEQAVTTPVRIDTVAHLEVESEGYLGPAYLIASGPAAVIVREPPQRRRTPRRPRDPDDDDEEVMT